MQVDIFHLNICQFSSCCVVKNGIHFKPYKVILSTKWKCTCEVMKLGSFTHIQEKKKTQGPTMYTSTTVCSLCIVELQQRHSELVNGAITSNNMSYLTKALSHCHWMWFMSNKNALSEFLVLFIVFLEDSGISCCIIAYALHQVSVCVLRMDKKKVPYIMPSVWFLLVLTTVCRYFEVSVHFHSFNKAFTRLLLF